MDIRGIEVTNQLRSAIRAKLLELGVRYDEELPDYILVMVVNKKTRQQMYEDLCLFLEESTSPFVDWLHDQVLKKLQKVTVAKKKSSRDLVPTVIVKQEEERKKKKTCPTSFLEDQTDTPEKSGAEKTKLPKKNEKLSKPNETDAEKVENAIKVNESRGSAHQEENEPLPLSPKKMTTSKTLSSNEPLSKSSIDAEIDVKMSEISSKNSKKIVEDVGGKVGASIVDPPVEDNEDEAEEESEDEDSRKRIKSSVNKPRITSVVTVKNRLEFPPRNQFDPYKNRPGFEGRYRKTVRGVDRPEFEGNRRGDAFGGRNNRGEDHFRRNLGKNHEFETRIQDPDRADIKSRLGNIREDKFAKVLEPRNRSDPNMRPRNTEKFSNSVKDRLGAGTSVKVRDNSKERLATLNLSIKNRLGPVKNIFKSPDVRRRFNVSERQESSDEDEDLLKPAAEDIDNEGGPASVGPVKSRIIAVKRSFTDKSDRKRSKVSKDVETEDKDEDEDVEDGKIASKVIVTPRPLKPLQPIQKRATQSLLLRAVAEANQSVVKQKNPEPVLMEKTTAPKRPAPIKMREGQNLSVRLNSSKRLVMEKIQVELTTGESDDNLPEPYVPQPVTDEHMGVVMSLFQRSNDSQKFLVTLNGYNNNGLKERSVSDEDERLEMEVNEDDDFLLANSNSEEYMEGKSFNGFQMIVMESGQNVDKTQEEENIDNLNIDNIEIDEDLPRKKRKLSPIVYNRSRSSTPVHTKPIMTPTVSVKHLERHIAVETVQQSVIDKSKEKCRYWPNCTLGIKCPYYHPAVLCSAFPGCKFGEKCLYKHPKCKFGLSCTKLGCVYSHPPRQCKYHPYCTNPTCAYTHPLPQVQPVEVVSNRAKFTWRKHE